MKTNLTAECAAYFDAETARDIAVINTEIAALEEFMAGVQMPEAAARIEALRAELAAIEPIDAKAWIAEAKAWAMDNYDNGADTLVECWDTSDYQSTWDSCGQNEKKAWRMLKRLCSVWAERQADARSYREC